MARTGEFAKTFDEHDFSTEHEMPGLSFNGTKDQISQS